jgi:integrase
MMLIAYYKEDPFMAAAQPIRSKKEIRGLAAYYLSRGEIRNYTFIVLGLHTALRVSDLLRLTWDDVYDFVHQNIRLHVRLVEKKTGKAKIIALNTVAIKALKLFARQSARKGRFLIENKHTKKAISRIQAYRLVRDAAAAIGIGRVSCHSLRKTFGYFAWKSGVSSAVIMEIYNHSSLEVTRRYLGVTQDDKDKVYRDLRLF